MQDLDVSGGCRVSLLEEYQSSVNPRSLFNFTPRLTGERESEKKNPWLQVDSILVTFVSTDVLLSSFALGYH